MTTEEKSLMDKIKEVLKEEGLEVTEEAVKAFVPVVLKIGQAMVDHTKTPYDNMAYAPLKSVLGDFLEDKAEDINPADNE